MSNTTFEDVEQRIANISRVVANVSRVSIVVDPISQRVAGVGSSVAALAELSGPILSAVLPPVDDMPLALRGLPKIAKTVGPLALATVMAGVMNKNVNAGALVAPTNA
ncbi:hypothetical protein [Methylocapsa acidiphila]|uniref:hypothetical protein n=1 Tax=Methylocapsa acidiphila TaxID=133552 RepID=UPI00041963E6|nr:hypothetical protein [Methylocapsa acidiphila]